jgi:16S rRNA (adenine1518-N6/adenine1519-N6)-dimethyltransferase
LLGAGDVRAIATRLAVRPTKKLGQNFVVEPGTVRQIAAIAGPFSADDVILEVGPGLGSLTLALLAAAVGSATTGSAATGSAATGSAATGSATTGSATTGSAATGSAASGSAATDRGARIIAVEIDPVLAGELPKTIAERAPGFADRVDVVEADALGLRAGDMPASPTVLAANLPYNVAVPVVLNLLAAFPSIARGVVMVQAEVADRMCAGPGSRVYGVPSAKLAWYATSRLAGMVPRSVFWPVPNVDSKLVAFARRPAGEVLGAVDAEDAEGDLEAVGAERAAGTVSREETFKVIDAAFGQRRKTLRAALGVWAGSPVRADALLRAAEVDPGARGEALTIAQFARIAAAAKASEAGSIPRS